jgi:hypothetical protein
LACVIAVSAAMTVVSVGPSFAQTTTEATPAAPKVVKKRHHILHPGIASASSRNVGPSSSASGALKDSPTAGAGNPSVPGAPSAGPANGGGGK